MVLKVFSVIVCIFACVYLLTSLKVFFVYFSHKYQRKKILKIGNNEKYCKDFYVFLPALREQSLVEETLKHFSSLNYPKEHLKIKVLTTEREEFEYQKSGKTTITTQTIAREVASKINTELGYDVIEVIHYPKTKGNKASQLNYGIETIKKDDIDITKTYVGLFDFDSRPEKDILLMSVNKAVQKKYPEVIQPLPVFLSNASELSKKPKNFMIICHSMFQAVRSFGIEAWRLLIAENSKIWLTPIYCMGAGLFLKLDSLIEIGGFPPTVDDIPLGFRLLNYNKKFCYLPSIVLGELPEKTKQVFNQSILIQRGNICAYQELKIKPEKNNSIWRKFLIWWEATSVIAIKSIIPFLLLAYWIYCICIGNFSIGFILITVAPFIRYLCGLSSYAFVKIKSINILTVILGFLFSPIWPFCKTYGVWKNLQLSIKKRLFKKEIEYKKTERGVN